MSERYSRISVIECILVWLAVAMVPCQAAEFTVTKTADTNDGSCSPADCSLREAIISSNGLPGADTIHVPAGFYLLTLAGRNEDAAATGDLDITGPLNLVGEGAASTIIDASGFPPADTDRVVDLRASGSYASFQFLTIQGGELGSGGGDADGGGLRIHGASTVVVLYCRIIDNLSNSKGGGIHNDDESASLIVVDSTIEGNEAIYGGGISTRGDLQLGSSSVSSNHASERGGGIYFTGSTQIRDMSVTNSTLYGNSASLFAPALWISENDATFHSATVAYNTGVGAPIHNLGGEVRFANTILQGSCFAESGGVFISDHGNLESPGNTCGLVVIFDLRLVPSPALLPLGNWGGPTRTAPPLDISPACDAPVATANCRTTDQRGVWRPQDGNGDGNAVCDIGSAEWTPDLLFFDRFETRDTSAWSNTVP